MSGFFWNIRGFNKKEKQRVVKDWIHQSKFDFGCLIETKVKESKAERLVRSIFPDWSFLANYEEHRLGRLWLVWRNNVRITPLYKTAQIITCSVYIEGRPDEFFVSFVYASNFVADRKSLWSDIKHHHNLPLFRDKAWMICGDFNEILEGDDHSLHDSSPPTPAGMRDFQDLVRICELTDMSYQGQRFTWCNKRQDGVICKKLDRVLVSKQ